MPKVAARSPFPGIREEEEGEGGEGNEEGEEERQEMPTRALGRICFRE